MTMIDNIILVTATYRGVSSTQSSTGWWVSGSAPDLRASPTPSVSLATSSTNTDRSALNLRKNCPRTEFVVHTLYANCGTVCSVTISGSHSHTHTHTHTRWEMQSLRPWQRPSVYRSRNLSWRRRKGRILATTLPQTPTKLNPIIIFHFTYTLALFLNSIIYL